MLKRPARTGLALAACLGAFLGTAPAAGESGRERVRREALEVEIGAMLARAEALAASGAADEAVDLLSHAGLALAGVMPGPSRDTLDARLAALRARIDPLKAETDRTRARTRAAAAEQDLLKEMDEEARRRAGAAAALRADFGEALRHHRWDEAERHLKILRDVDPRADDLDRLAERLSGERLAALRDANRASMAEEWRTLRELSNEQRIPYAGDSPLRYPDGWSRLTRGREQELLQAGRKDEAWRSAMTDRLRRAVPIRFDATPLEDALEHLSRTGNLALNVDPAAREALPDLDTRTVTFRSGPEGVSLSTALGWALQGTGLTWTLRDEAVLVTTAAGAQEPSCLERHDVRDILAVPRDFQPPKISLSAGQANPGTEITEVEDEEAAFTGESLIELLKQYVNPVIWNEPQNSMACRNGVLIVNAPPATHEALRKTLAGFRTQRALEVLIQTRFVLVNELAFQGLQIDFRGVNPALAGPNPTGNAPTVFPWGFQNSGVTDTRAQTFNPPGNLPYFPRAFNGAVTPNGAGNQLQVALLDDFQIAALVTAAEQHSTGLQATVPSILCFNTQRANLLSFNQQAYIQDFTAVVQVQAVGYDPEVAYIQTGVVFDVRPIVSADRKYITLELAPTVGQLRSMRSVPAVAGTTLNIEAPIVLFESARTTVSVPDGGTLALAGLTYVDEVKGHTGVPFLSKIPFLQTLFSGKAESLNRQNLVILVRAKIVDPKETQERLFGKD